MSRLATAVDTFSGNDMRFFTVYFGSSPLYEYYHKSLVRVFAIHYEYVVGRVWQKREIYLSKNIQVSFRRSI